MATMESREFLAGVNREQRKLARLTWPFLVGYVVLTSGFFMAFDLYAPDSAALYFWASMFAWAADYLLLVLLLQRGRLLRAGQGSGVGTFVVVGIATGLPIALGIIVLIVPGLYLLMRWLPVYARARVVDDWTGNSMRWSWRATEPFQKPLSIALIGPVLCYAGSYAPYVLDTLSMTMSYEVAAVITDVFLPVGGAWLSVLGIAAYAMLTAVNGEETDGDGA
jgi:hypothetical protein